MKEKEPKVVIAPKGCKSYLTEGKKYEVKGIWDSGDKINGYGFYIKDDENKTLMCSENSCFHLNNGNWIIKERKDMKINDIISKDQINKLKEASKLASELTDKFEKLFEVVNKKPEPKRLVNIWDIEELPSLDKRALIGIKAKHTNKLKALSRIMILADYYNQGWEADWSNSDQKKWLVKQTSNRLIVDDYRFVNFGFPPFKSEELLRTAIDNNREIFEAALK